MITPTSPRILASAALGIALLAPAAAAQAPPAAPPPDAQQAAAAAAVRSATPAERAATLTYANRPIVTLRATVLSRTPAERAVAAVSAIDRLVNEAPWGTVSATPIADGYLVSVDERGAFAIVPQDADQLAGETPSRLAEDAVARLRVAFAEAVEARNPSRLLQSSTLALAATLAFIAALRVLRRSYRFSVDRLGQGAERQIQRLPGGELIISAAHAPEIVRRLMTVAAWGLALLLADMWLTFVLRQFPYTRPWGESLRSALLNALTSAGGSVLHALPDLLVVLLIVLVTRLLVRVATLIFDAIAEERLSLPAIYPETALPTRRIVVALLWLFALVASYGYLPGSDSEAFKGVSVFVGLMVSLGSSGVMNQVMSGFTITYSRAVRLGDFVKVGDTEGTVVHLGALATKIKTPRREEITIPNAVVVSTTTTNYSRLAQTEGVMVPTSVTIGYDAPWRQVHALLLLAASRTAGVRAQPEPVVRQSALQDFCVEYTLLVSLEQPDMRAPVLDALHRNIQDAFNEYGVQIMSPHYESDPSGPKVVPREQWFAAPARPDVED